MKKHNGMEASFFALVFLATAAICSGQSTTTFVPKSTCGIRAQMCYDSQRQVMDNKFDALDYVGACQIYKGIRTCMENVGTCSSDTDFEIVHQELDDDQDGICGVDGSVQSCGFDVKVCFTEMDAAVAYAMSANFSSACPLILKFATCVTSITNNNECPPSLMAELTKIQQSLSGDTDLIGCDGPCPQAVSVCTANATILPTDKTVLTADIQGFCKSAVKVYNCLANLTTSPVCAKSPQSYMISIAQNELAKIDDICNIDGSISDCVKDLALCASDLIQSKNVTDTKTQCKIAAEFMECTSRLPCTSTLAPLIVNLRNALETIEIENTCPSVGSCNDRFTNCGLQVRGLNNITADNKNTICKQALNGFTCIDFVKNDPLCINEKSSFISEELDLNSLYLALCGTNAITVASTTPGIEFASFIPKSDCGIPALKCFTDSQSAMVADIQILNYASACQIFKSITNCMNSIGDCSSDADFLVVQQQLVGEGEGICGTDGSILGCGKDVYVCFVEMNTAISDSLSNNISAACPAIAQFVTCAGRLSKIKECPDSLDVKLNQMIQTLGSDKDMLGCDGPCAQAIAKCTMNTTALPTDQSLLELDLYDYCQSANKVYSCLNGLTTNPVCSGLPQEYWQSVAQNELNKIVDVCTSDGSPSVCVQNLVECAISMPKFENGVDIFTQCQASSTFLECISDLPCSSTLTPLITNFRYLAETVEVKDVCPSVGSCSDRFARCGLQEEELMNVSLSNTADFCKKAKQGKTCFDFVDNDPVCITEINKFATAAQNINMLINLQCKGGVAALKFVHLSLFVAALLASLRQYL